MAVFQGARMRGGALPPREVAARSRPTTSTIEGSSSRARPIGLLIAAILAATMLGLVYLTQTLGSNATSSQISSMGAKSETLRGNLRTQDWTVELYMKPSDIAKRAKQQGLRPLGQAVVLPAP